jgi:hypothetical protein
MSYVYGLFDNDDDVRKAINGLERVGRGGEVVEVITQPETTTPSSVEGASSEAPQVDTPLVPVASVIPAATTTSGGMLAGALIPPRHLAGLGELSDYFSRAVEKGAQLVVVDTSDPDVVASLFRDANAQRIYDKRAGRDV